MSPAAWEALIPRTWSARKALAITRLLEVVRDAIWAVHGEHMLDELALIDRPPVYTEPIPHREDYWDDIPF